MAANVLSGLKPFDWSPKSHSCSCYKGKSLGLAFVNRKITEKKTSTKKMRNSTATHKTPLDVTLNTQHLVKHEWDAGNFNTHSGRFRTTNAAMFIYCRHKSTLTELNKLISGRPRDLRCMPVAACLLGLRVRIPPQACECCVVAGRSLYDATINRRGMSYQVWVCHCVWSHATITLYTYNA